MVRRFATANWTMQEKTALNCCCGADNDVTLINVFYTDTQHDALMKIDVGSVLSLSITRTFSIDTNYQRDR